MLVVVVDILSTDLFNLRKSACACLESDRTFNSIAKTVSPVVNY
jgi:hypothetical protein